MNMNTNYYLSKGYFSDRLYIAPRPANMKEEIGKLDKNAKEQVGMKVYGTIRGWLLSRLGLATEIHLKDSTVYVTKKNYDAWASKISSLAAEETERNTYFKSFENLVSAFQSFQFLSTIPPHEKVSLIEIKKIFAKQESDQIQKTMQAFSTKFSGTNPPPFEGEVRLRPGFATTYDPNGSEVNKEQMGKAANQATELAKNPDFVKMVHKWRDQIENEADEQCIMEKMDAFILSILKDKKFYKVLNHPIRELVITLAFLLIDDGAMAFTILKVDKITLQDASQGKYFYSYADKLLAAIFKSSNDQI